MKISRSAVCAILAALLQSVVAYGHEYWLEPERFFLGVHQSSPVRLFLGEGLKVEEERPFQRSKTVGFRLISVHGNFDLTGPIADEAKPLFSFSADRAGNYLLAMERNWSYITLEPEKFEDYLRTDGMEYIVAERLRLNESKQEGRERYSRFIKALINVGGRRDRSFGLRAGHRLEIIPIEDPYSRKVGSNIGFSILFEGKPLAGRTVFADNRDGEKLSTRRAATDENGRVFFALDQKGVWLIRLVFMQRCARNCEGADWESFWAAFTFGAK